MQPVARSAWARAAIAALFAATAGCAAPSTPSSSIDEIPEPEEQAALEMEIDQITLRRGAVRISATMADGSPDVSVRLGEGEGCDEREVGRGIASRTGFVWSLTSDELARAHQCDLEVVVRTVEDGRRIKKTAKLVTVITLSGDDDDTAKIADQTPAGDSTTLTFSTISRATRLSASGALIGAEDGDDDDDSTDGRYVSRYVVPNEDLARAVVSRRPLTIAGVGFAATVRIGNAELDLEEPETGAVGEVTVVGDG